MTNFGSFRAKLVGIGKYLPKKRLYASELGRIFPDANIDKLERRTGIRSRSIAASDEYVSDLACLAAEDLFARVSVDRSRVDYLILCTQSPDHLLPTTACILQERLCLRTDIGAIDLNQGCSGFVYSLGLAVGLLSTGQAQHVLLITADTYSKYLGQDDLASRAIFGDGAAAVLLKETSPGDRDCLGPFVYGTDGSGADHLILRNSGAKGMNGSSPILPRLTMRGSEVFSFAVKSVPILVNDLLSRAQLAKEDIDMFFFHQANALLLEEIALISGIPRDKMFFARGDGGNTVSSTLPLALLEAHNLGLIKANSLLAVIGFGVGFSWAGTLIAWSTLDQGAE